MLKLAAVLASLGCFGAGLYLLSIESASADPTVFEAMAQGIGIYFIAKGFFVGPALWLYARQAGALEWLVNERYQATPRKNAPPAA